MSKPRNFWWGMMLQMLRRYPKGIPGNTKQGALALKAVEEAVEKTKAEHPEDGEERIKLVNLVYFKNTHTYAGAGMILHVSERTARRWGADFVYTVAKLMGYLPED